MSQKPPISKPNAHGLICVAVISGAFGIKGELKIKSFTEKPEDCLAYGPLTDEKGQRVITPLSARPVKKALAVICEEVTSREQAEAMAGIKLYIPRSALPEPDEDDFYYSDLVGLSVKSQSGKLIGTIHAMHDFGAGDMMEIQPCEKQAKLRGSAASYYHPFTKAAVPKVDIKAGRVIIIEPDIINAKAPPEDINDEANNEIYDDIETHDIETHDR